MDQLSSLIESNSDTHTLRLQGRRLLLARVTSMVVAMTTLGLFLAAIPLRYLELSTPPAAIQLGLAHLDVSVSFYRGYELILDILLVGAYTAIAIVLFWRRSDEWMALFVACFLVVFEVTQQPTFYALTNASALWIIPVSLLTIAGWIGLNLFFLLFPSGHFVPRWTVWSIPLSICYVILWQLPTSLMFYPANWPFPLAAVAEVGITALNLFAQIYRYRRFSDPIQRQQTRWIVFATVLKLIAAGSANLAPLFFPALTQVGSWYDLFGSSLLAPFTLLIPGTLGIAILRYHLWNIDPIINRTLVYGALTACIVGVYILVVGYLGALFRTGNTLPISLLATGLVAILFQPLREYLQRKVNRLMYGERDTPYKIIAHLGQRLEATLAPDAVLPTITETLARALKLPYVALTFAQETNFTMVAAYGSPTEQLLHMPLIYQNTQVGELLLAPRGRGEIFTPADLRLLNDLARQVGIAAHAVRLTTDLQHSRERLVTTREEERRRLRRDLHDGLGPTLAGFSLKVGAVRNLLLPGQEIADTFLNELSTDIEGAISDIRRIIYDLRPPSLDELGLVGALHARAAQYNTPPGKLNVLVQTPKMLPPFPAAIEVAVYRIFQEALNNVVRHAEAQTCRVILSVAREVCIEIIDDGRGLPATIHMGVGLLAMRERAVELGGTCTIETAQPCGTHVGARFPLLEE